MKRIETWRCEYCGGEDHDVNKMMEHEKTCYRNPSMKTCDTCILFDENNYDYGERIDLCRIRHSSEHIENIRENKIPCDDWKR